MAVGTGGDDTDVVGVLDSDDGACGEDNFLPGLADIEDMDSCPDNEIFSEASPTGSLTVSPPLPDVGFHLLIAVFCANVALGSKEKLDLLLGRTQDRW